MTAAQVAAVDAGHRLEEEAAKLALRVGLQAREDASTRLEPAPGTARDEQEWEAGAAALRGLAQTDVDPAQLRDISPTDLRRLLALRVEALRRSAPFSLMSHARLIHRDSEGRPIVPAAHHYEWVRVMEDRERYPWVVIVAPPGFAKSTWSTWTYPTWRIGATHGRSRIGVVANAAGQAGAWVSAIGDSVQSQPFRASYPDVRADKKRGWGKSRFYVTGAPAGPNPTCLASGIGGVSVLGKRFDEIVLDDPTTWENARSQTVMDGQRHWLKTTLISRFPPGMGPPDGIGGRMLVVLTRWSEFDLVPTLADLGFTVIRMPALGYWDGLGDPAAPDFEPGEQPLWPEQMSREQLESQREDDPLVFELVMQGNARILSGDVFDASWFRRGVPPERGEFDRVVQFWDTAGGQDRKRGDFAVCVTLGRITMRNERGKDEKRWWVLHVDRDRYSSLRQFDKLKYNAQIWEPNQVIVENVNEGRALYDRARAETNLPVKPFTPVKDKEFRAMGIAGKYRGGHIWHPASPDGTSERWVRAFEAELEAFPNSEHDDQVDAVSGAFNAMQGGKARLRVLG